MGGHVLTSIVYIWAVEQIPTSLVCAFQAVATDFSENFCLEMHFSIHFFSIFYVHTMEKELLYDWMWVDHCHRYFPKKNIFILFRRCREKQEERRILRNKFSAYL